MAPIAGWTAVVDGTGEGLPDTPLRMMQHGRINRNPEGGPLQVLFGTNQDEMALFIMNLDLLIPHIPLPVDERGVRLTAEHQVQYHDNWNQSTVAQIEKAYPSSQYAHEAYRLVQYTTDFVFRCGTRRAAREMSEAGLDVYLYNFNHHIEDYKAPESMACELSSMLGCGVHHAQELRFVFDNYQLPFDHKDQDVSHG
jgi:carboxylesterase type B